MLVYLLIGLLIALVAYWLWGQQQKKRVRSDNEREERRARTDELLSRALHVERPGEGRRTVTGGKRMAKPVPPTIERMAKPVDGAQRIDINVLLGDEPDAVAERARRQLERPTNFAPELLGDAASPRTTTLSSASPLSLQDGGIDVPLEDLVLAWFEARGYTTRPAPQSAMPVRWLLTHRDDRARSYAFVYERGRLNAQRAARMLEQARALGANRLLVAAEHGADPAVASARLRDVQTMDWVAIDREMKKIDFRVAAKIIAIARERSAHRGGMR